MGVVLEKNRDCLPKIRQLQCTDVLAVYEYLTLGWIVKSDYKLENGALAGPVCTNDDLFVSLQRDRS